MSAKKSIEEKLLAIRALAEKGSDGERAAAEHKLKLLMEKHNISEADLDAVEPAQEWYGFPASTKYEKMLAQQCAHRATNRRYVSIHKEKAKVWIKMTASEALDTDILYSHYRRLWKRSLEDMMQAFLSKNNIFARNPVDSLKPQDENRPPDLSLEDIARIRRMMAGLNREDDPITKRLDDGSHVSLTDYFRKGGIDEGR